MFDSSRNTYALTVKQPWASLIMEGFKTVENRLWPPPERLLGQRFAIHSGKAFDSRAMADSKVLQAIRRIPYPLPQGFLIGTVLLSGVLEPDGSPRAFPGDCLDGSQADRSWWMRGFYGWILREPILLETPVPMAGRLGLWILRQ